MNNIVQLTSIRYQDRMFIGIPEEIDWVEYVGYLGWITEHGTLISVVSFYMFDMTTGKVLAVWE